jgi:hypothetical protein
MTRKPQKPRATKTKSAVRHHHVSLAWQTLCLMADTKQPSMEHSDEKK